MEYEIIRSENLAKEAVDAYTSGAEFLYDHVHREEIVSFAKGTATRLNLRANPQRRSLKGILVLFIEPYTAGARDSEKFFNPDIKKVSVTVNGAPNKLYNNGLDNKDLWEEASRFFMKKTNKTQHMNLKKVYTGDRFGLLIDLKSMAANEMHGSGVRLVNTKDGVLLEIERTASGSGNVNCHIFTISDAQFNVQGRQLQSVEL